MATTIPKFIQGCYEIVKAKPAYELGCSSKSKCDCIGMIKYSMRVNNVSFSTSGTNYTFRNQVDNIRKITSAAILCVGDVVFKMKTAKDSGYNLPSKYRKGGSDYNGDLNDYTHIGVVQGINPLRIIHMTSPTAKTDYSIGNWKYAAQLKDRYVNYDISAPSQAETPATTTPAQNQETASSSETAIVIAEKGLWVKMRAQPSEKCGLYDDVPIGAKVTVIKEGDKWSKIDYGRRKGWYMMTKFLRFNNTVG